MNPIDLSHTFRRESRGPRCVGNVYLADTKPHSIRYLDVIMGTLEVLVSNVKKGDGPDGNDPLNC
ncbi:MAG: hypothetical protein ACOYMN_21150 [Roseimicrobium sp.]